VLAMCAPRIVALISEGLQGVKEYVRQAGKEAHLWPLRLMSS